MFATVTTTKRIEFIIDEDELKEILCKHLRTDTDEHTSVVLRINEYACNVELVLESSEESKEEGEA
jgi:hypothetical protein